MRPRRLACASLLLAACGADGGAGDGGAVLGEIEAAACLTATGCGIVADDISRCTANVVGVSLPVIAQRSGVSHAQVSCLAAAKADCAAARRCLNGGMTPQTCSPGRSSCSGGTLNGCSDVAGAGGTYGTTQTDCAAFGEQCVAVGVSSASCGIATCTTAPPACVGDRVQTCDSGIVHQLDCAQYDAACVATGAPHCHGIGPVCTGSIMNPMLGIRCDGAKLIYCFDGQEARLDCAAARLDCLPNVNGEPFGCALGNQCNPATFTSSCAAGRLTFCNAGRITTADCIARGFKSCQAMGPGRCL